MLENSAQIGLSKQKPSLTKYLEEGLQARLDPAVQMASLRMHVLPGSLFCFCNGSCILRLQPVESFTSMLALSPISFSHMTLCKDRKTLSLGGEDASSSLIEFPSYSQTNYCNLSQSGLTPEIKDKV